MVSCSHSSPDFFEEVKYFCPQKEPRASYLVFYLTLEEEVIHYQVGPKVSGSGSYPDLAEKASNYRVEPKASGSVVEPKVSCSSKKLLTLRSVFYPSIVKEAIGYCPRCLMVSGWGF